jgi:hypothetical protein
MDYDLGCFDLDTRRLKPDREPFRTESVTRVSGTDQYPLAEGVSDICAEMVLYISLLDFSSFVPITLPTS